jgi:hypothetical protein
MARVVYGGGVTEFIGSIGGTTFQSNGSGFIARLIPKITKRRTTLQVNQISIFSYYSQLYRNLSGSDRATWEALAAAESHTNLWNKTSVVNGLHWFLTVNSTNVQLGNAISNTAPAYTLSTALPVLTAAYAGNVLNLDSATPFGIAGEKIMIYATSPLKGNTGQNRKLFKLIGISNANTIQPKSLNTMWQNTFGLSVANDLVAVGANVIVAVTKVDNSIGIPLPFSFART